MVHYLRRKLAKALSKLSQFYQRFVQEGEIYGLLYALEESILTKSSQKTGEQTTISRGTACIIGRSHASSFLPALALPTASTIYVSDIESFMAEVIQLYDS